MIRILLLLALVATSANSESLVSLISSIFGKLFSSLTSSISSTITSDCDSPALKVRFAYTLAIGKTAFINMPVNATAATAEGWEQRTGPSIPSGLSSLTLMCPCNESLLCLYYDDNGNVAGVQTALNADNSTAVFNTTTQGYTNWTTTVNGTNSTYWVSSLYFISEEELKVDAATRKANYNSSKILQNGSLWVTSFNGELMKVSSATAFSDSSNFTKQNCVPWMGHHYFYNMTNTTECSADQILPWFLLEYNGDIKGVGHLHIGTATSKYCEHPSQTAVEFILNDRPSCISDLAKSPGAVTSHIYFVKNPECMTCL